MKSNIVLIKTGFSCLVMAVALLLTQPATVLADTASQDVSTQSKTKVTCTTGSYGQNLNCVAEADASASAKQQVIIRGDTRIEPHKPVAASLDFKTLAFAATTALTGAAGIVIKYIGKI